ncbi:MAG: hypothetical protein ACO29O_08095 [Chitinophagaceae bacterium]
MKRMIVAAMLLCGTGSVFAAEQKSEMRNRDVISIVKKEKDQGEAVVCTVSLSASIGPEYMQVTVTCSASASTCKEAIATAKSCIEDAKKAVF